MYIQDAIPIKAIYDEIFRVSKDKYSKTFKFTDVNYAVTSRVVKIKKKCSLNI